MILNRQIFLWVNNSVKKQPVFTFTRMDPREKIHDILTLVSQVIPPGNRPPDSSFEYMKIPICTVTVFSKRTPYLDS